jgi:hypothetical protein
MSCWHEHGVRMDTKTAVQIASVGNLPSEVILELEASHESEMPGPLLIEPPVVASQEVNEVTKRVARKYRDKLHNRLRQAREARRLDADIARSAVVYQRMLREERISRWLAWASAAVGIGLIIAVLLTL